MKEEATHPRAIFMLGVPFHDVTMAGTLEWIDRIIERGTPCYLATANLDFAAQASRDVELQRLLIEAELVLCDGTPLVWASRWIGAPLRERVAGSDLMPHLFAHAAKRGYRVFFLGATDEVLEAAKAGAESGHPGLEVCGMYAPPFRKLHEIDSGDLLARVRAARPDILLVAMGCPKQEKWIYANHRKSGVPVSIGIGASLDFVAGKFRRAPEWMRRCGLEWLYRLSQEPRRLLSRYAFDLLFFAAAMRRERRAAKAAKAGARERPEPVAGGASRETLRWTGRVDADACGRGACPFPDFEAIESGAPVVLDLSSVSFIDSAGIGRLVSLLKACRGAGRELYLLRPSQTVRKVLKALRIEGVFEWGDDVAGVVAGGLQRGYGIAREGGDCLVVRVHGDLTAVCADALRSELSAAWEGGVADTEGGVADSEGGVCVSGICFDLSCVRFMDSSGLGVLVAAYKLARSRGGEVRLIGVNERVRNVLSLARLESLFVMEGGEG